MAGQDSESDAVMLPVLAAQRRTASPEDAAHPFFRRTGAARALALVALVATALAAVMILQPQTAPHRSLLVGVPQTFTVRALKAT
eukprot:643772-Rhodomonas_salina.2